MNDLLKIETTKNIEKDVENIIVSARETAYKQVNTTLILRNWLIGKRISEEELGNKTRSENYGKEIIEELAINLTKKYGKGFTRTNLYYFYQFYNSFPKIIHTVCGQSPKELLSWSHYRILLRVFDENAREWYANEAYKESWSVRTLERNVESQYYFRLLKSQIKEPIKNETNKSKPYEDKMEYIKNPVIAEFLGYSLPTDYNETDLEKGTISNIQKVMMELGKGYAFVARQYHIQTETEDYYIDLVFYNYILKCFVLIDFKKGKIKHQDVGQMDMYIRMFDKLKKGEDDNPTLGIILCSETDEDIARYSILEDSKQIFQSKYKLYLPPEDEIKREIERAKEMIKNNKIENLCDTLKK